MIAAVLNIVADLTPTEEKRLADVLSTVACEIMKGEYKTGKFITMEIAPDAD